MNSCGINKIYYEFKIILNNRRNPYEKSNEPSWGSSVLGGTYLETLTGPHSRPIYIKGKFLITRVSNIGTLN